MNTRNDKMFAAATQVAAGYVAAAGVAHEPKDIVDFSLQVAEHLISRVYPGETIQVAGEVEQPKKISRGKK